MLRYYEPELADDAGDYVTILGFACKRGDGLKSQPLPEALPYFFCLWRRSTVQKIHFWIKIGVF